MKHYHVRIETTVYVTIDETRFTPEFMQGFKQSFYDFATIEEHVRNLARWRAEGIIVSDSDFQEGYGELDQFGIRTRIVDTEVSDCEDVTDYSTAPRP